MKNGELYIDDRFEIPEDIKNMSKEELRAEIERLEAEAREKKMEKQKKVALVQQLKALTSVGAFLVSYREPSPV